MSLITTNPNGNFIGAKAGETSSFLEGEDSLEGLRSAPLPLGELALLRKRVDELL